MARFDRKPDPAKRTTARKPPAIEGPGQGHSRTTDFVTERLRKKVGVRRAIHVALTRRGA